MLWRILKQHSSNNKGGQRKLPSSKNEYSSSLFGTSQVNETASGTETENGSREHLNEMILPMMRELGSSKYTEPEHLDLPKIDVWSAQRGVEGSEAEIRHHPHISDSEAKITAKPQLSKLAEMLLPPQPYLRFESQKIKADANSNLY